MTRRRRPGVHPGVSSLRGGSFRRVLRTQALRRGDCRARHPGDRRSPCRAPTPTGPASPPPWKQPATRSPPPAGITGPGDPADTGRIGRAVLDSLQPAWRARYSARKVKCATSCCLNRDDGRPQQTTVITRVEITILTPPPDRPAARSRTRKNDPAGPRPRQPKPDARRDKITQIMTSAPGRDWSGRELAGRLGVRLQVMLTQLAEWTRLGLLARTGPGRYALPAAGSPGP